MSLSLMPWAAPRDADKLLCLVHSTDRLFGICEVLSVMISIRSGWKYFQGQDALIWPLDSERHGAILPLPGLLI